MSGVEQELQNQRGEIDSLMNQLRELDIDSLKESIKQEIFEQDHPIGSPYFTGSVSDNPNDKYPGSSWERLDSNTYIVAAGDGLNALQQVGSNTKSFSIDWLHNHPQNPHVHENYNRTSNFSSTGNQYGGRMGTAGDNSGTITATAPTTATNQSAGTQQSNKTINVQPNSVALYVWIRTA
ncbi:MAG: hypothetical protein ISP01_05190 [Methanobrevibacter arboriphilus]|uniref:Tail fiber protein n=1 Tax=Methanobrevibacter arboriphilus TaxID=39441 RepID=A0A843ACS2_METAZ|nr:hypothetical protein [Methanobrevibacter arboriphilus]MBF4468782.1 hypothetical protein [Methanobrevibacter arboriphilus]